MNEKQDKRPKPYPAEKARQAEIELRRPWQRAVFILGLAGGAILAVATRAFGLW